MTLNSSSDSMCIRVLLKLHMHEFLTISMSKRTMTGGKILSANNRRGIGKLGAFHSSRRPVTNGQLS